jgi:hypothetical protein
LTEYEDEPIRGLPGELPPGEKILWQGSPDRKALARTAFSTRAVTGYFLLLTAWAVGSAVLTGGDFVGVVMTGTLGVLGIALLQVLAWASARSTIYTLTNRRIVLRIGIAVPKCINLPLAMIGSVDLATRADGTGDVPLTLAGSSKISILALWPHARPWKVTAPQPMLRAIPDAQGVAALIAQTCSAVTPDHSVAAAPQAQRTSPYMEAVAA